MNKRLRVYGLVALTLAVIGVVFIYGDAEISALTWHIRHGSHVNVGGVNILVPLTFVASDPAGLPSVLITRSRGVLWHEAGFIDINFRTMRSPEDEARLMMLGPKTTSTITHTKLSEQGANFAGRPGKCAEYNTQLHTPRFGVGSYEIFCRFNGGTSARFMGSPGIKDIFYNIIQTAEPLSIKN